MVRETDKAKQSNDNSEVIFEICKICGKIRTRFDKQDVYTSKIKMYYMKSTFNEIGNALQVMS